ncbi:DUF6090 family protein [Saccharicrinis sp. FJH2]|uniref:DUF6090 family protein n=1 Tax=Saccharicrinis sp. FJH65 TaxID=3344659 RepID=UPI0035F25918
MTTFFRNIRQKLAAQNKVAAYLRYAIGEILLVVIGILIALQVNNWNSIRIEKNKESVYLKNIERDLIEQRKSIDDQLKTELVFSQMAKSILTYYKEFHKFNVDSSFTSAIGGLCDRRTFVKINPTYTELLSSGNVDIISDNKFKGELINYYQELERLELIINKNNNLFTDAVFVPGVMRLSELQTSSVYDDILTSNLLSQHVKDSLENYIRLNEKNLKAITASQLEDPANQLIMINLINYRYITANIHYAFLLHQKEKTQNLIDELKLILRIFK